MEKLYWGVLVKRGLENLKNCSEFDIISFIYNQIFCIAFENTNIFYLYFLFIIKRTSIYSLMNCHKFPWQILFYFIKYPSEMYFNFYAQAFFIISEYPINFRLITAANFSDFSQDPLRSPRSKLISIFPPHLDS